MDKVDNIKNNILADVNKAYKDKGLTWVKPRLKGDGIYSTRTVILDGEAPNGTQKEEAKKLAFLQKGVFSVEDNLGLAQSTEGHIVTDNSIPKEKEALLEKKMGIDNEPTKEVKKQELEKKALANLHINKDKDGKITISGIVGSLAVLNALTDKAKQLFGDDKVVNELTVGDNVSDLPKDDALLAIDELSALDYGHMDIVDNNLTFEGHLDKESKRDNLVDAFKQHLSTNINSNIKLSAPPVKVEEQKVEVATVDLEENKTVVAENELSNIIQPNIKTIKEEEKKAKEDSNLAILLPSPKTTEENTTAQETPKEEEKVLKTENNISQTKEEKKTLANLHINKDKDGKITISGIVSDLDTLNTISLRAKQLFGDDKVVNELMVRDNVSNLPKDDALLAIDELSALDYGHMDIVDNNLTFEGYLDRESTRDRLVEEFKQHLSTNINSDIKLSVPPIKIEEMKLEDVTIAGKEKNSTTETKNVLADALESSEKEKNTEKEEEKNKKTNDDLAQLIPTIEVSKPVKDDLNDTVSSVTNTTNITEEEAKKEALTCQEKFANLLASQKINFKYNSAKIDKSSYKLLDNLKETMVSCPNSAFIIEGHTDSDGSARYNLKLSQKRSNAIREYFLNKGIDSSKLVAIGYGESKPIASNKTSEGKAKNRRIEIKAIPVNEVASITKPTILTSKNIAKVTNRKNVHHKKLHHKVKKYQDLGAAYCQERFDELTSSQKIYFSLDKKRVANKSKKLLDSLANIAKSCPNTKIYIEAHTDSIGTDEENLKLSQTKALTVKRYLQKRGIKSSRLIAKGYGESMPIADNATTFGRSQNRRIEFKIKENE